MKKPILDLPDSVYSRPTYLWVLVSSAIAFVGGILFKILHWPFGSYIILTSGVTMIIYFMLRLYNKESRNWRHYTLFASLSLTTLGVTFRYIGLENFRYLLLPGLLILAVYILITLILYLRR